MSDFSTRAKIVTHYFSQNVYSKKPHVSFMQSSNNPMKNGSQNSSSLINWLAKSTSCTVDDYESQYIGF